MDDERLFFLLLLFLWILGLLLFLSFPLNVNMKWCFANQFLLTDSGLGTFGWFHKARATGSKVYEKSRSSRRFSSDCPKSIAWSLIPNYETFDVRLSKTFVVALKSKKAKVNFPWNIFFIFFFCFTCASSPNTTTSLLLQKEQAVYTSWSKLWRTSLPLLSPGRRPLLIKNNTWAR